MGIFRCIHSGLHAICLHVLIFLVLPFIMPLLVACFRIDDPKRWWARQATKWTRLWWEQKTMDNFNLLEWQSDVTRTASPSEENLGSDVTKPLVHIFHYECSADLYLHDVLTNHGAVLMSDSSLGLLGDCVVALLKHFVHRRWWQRIPQRADENLALHSLLLGTRKGGDRNQMIVYPEALHVANEDGTFIASVTPDVIAFIHANALAVKIWYTEGTSNFMLGDRSRPVTVISFPVFNAATFSTPDDLQFAVQRSFGMAERWHALKGMQSCVHTGAKDNV